MPNRGAATASEQDLLRLIAEEVLIAESVSIEDLVCVTNEAFKNVVERLAYVSLEAARVLEEEWHLYEVRHTMKGTILRGAVDELCISSLCLRCMSKGDNVIDRATLDNIPTCDKILYIIGPRKDNAEIFAILLKYLYRLSLSATAFKDVLVNCLNRLLNQDCRVIKEYSIATGARLDVFVECPEFVIAFELKTPEEGTRASASHNPIGQMTLYLSKLQAVYQGKQAAIILTRTDGAPPLDALTTMFEQALERSIATSIHILFKNIIDHIIKQAKRQARQDGKNLTTRLLLSFIASGRLSTTTYALRLTDKY